MTEAQDNAGDDQDFMGIAGVQRYHEHSRPNRYIRLEVGESASDSVLFDFNETNREDFDAACTNLRNVCNRARMRATERTGREFEMNSGTFLTSRNNDIVFTVVMTRRT